MRGTIIMWSGEKGVATAGGQRYDFDINTWQGAVAPAANMTVDITADGGKLTAVKPVDDAAIAKEKLAAMTGKGGEMAKAVYANVGMDVAIAYGVFLVVGLLFSMVASGGIVDINISLADLLTRNDLAMLTGSNGKGIFLLFLATATIVVPYFWKHRFAPLAFAVPLLFTLYGFWPMWEKYREAKKLEEQMGEEMRQLAEAFGQMAQQMGASDGGGGMGSLGIGAYIIFATVLYLAYKGVTRFLGRS
ncbi:MAG: hypothetical protein ACT4UP_06615 [Gammaproteobacteria bacterium]